MSLRCSAIGTLAQIPMTMATATKPTKYSVMTDLSQDPGSKSPFTAAVSQIEAPIKATKVPRAAGTFTPPVRIRPTPSNPLETKQLPESTWGLEMVPKHCLAISARPRSNLPEGCAHKSDSWNGAVALISRAIASARFGSTGPFG